jgi:hypothetical protein
VVAEAPLVRRRLTQERGTAIFVVVLVLALLTGIGLFAARVTGSVDAATGYARQSAQTKALAVFAAQMAPNVLAKDKESIGVQMDLTKTSGTATQCPTNLYQKNGECAVRNHQDLIRVSGGTAETILASQKIDAAGSLGPQTTFSTLKGVEGNLRVEYFERCAAPPVAGNSKGSNGAGPTTPFEYGITASAQIRPLINASNADWCSPDNETSSANIQAIRMYVTVP